MSSPNAPTADANASVQSPMPQATAEWIDRVVSVVRSHDEANRKSGSFASQVLDLAIGESTCRARAVDPTMPVGRLGDELPMIREQLRNATKPAVARAKERRKDSAYTVEVGDVVMPSGNLYVVAVVTRLA